MVRLAVAVPAPFVTVTETGYEPATGVVPEIVPDAASMVRPAGRPLAANASGACPVAATVYRNGLPAMAPMSPELEIRGLAGGAVIEMAMSVCAARAAGAAARTTKMSSKM